MINSERSTSNRWNRSGARLAGSLLVVLALLLAAAPAWGAVAYDNAVCSSEFTDDTTFDITPVGTVRGVVVLIGIYTASILGDIVASVTANAAGLPQAGSQQSEAMTIIQPLRSLGFETVYANTPLTGGFA